MKELYKDIVTANKYSFEEGIFINDLDKELVNLIRKDFKHIRKDDFISQQSLMTYRLKRINDMIVTDKKVNRRMRDRFTKVLNDDYYQEIDVQKHLDETNTIGQKVADIVAKFGGSWTFIIPFIAFLIIWVIINSLHLFGLHWDPYPFILLNLMLSMIAALQAPLIMMSQNRSAEYDRLESKNDFRVNQKTEMEIRLLHSKIDHIIQQDQPNLLEVQRLQTEMLYSLGQQLQEIREKVQEK